MGAKTFEDSRGDGVWNVRRRGNGRHPDRSEMSTTSVVNVLQSVGRKTHTRYVRRLLTFVAVSRPKAVTPFLAATAPDLVIGRRHVKTHPWNLSVACRPSRCEPTSSERLWSAAEHTRALKHATGRPIYWCLNDPGLYLRDREFLLDLGTEGTATSCYS